MADNTNIGINFTANNAEFIKAMQSAQGEVDGLTASVVELQAKLSSGGTLSAKDVARWRQVEESAKEIARSASNAAPNVTTQKTFGGAVSSPTGGMFNNMSKEFAQEMARGMEAALSKTGDDFAQLFNGRAVRGKSAYSGGIRLGRTGAEYAQDTRNEDNSRLERQNSQRKVSDYTNIRNSMRRYNNVTVANGGVISHVDYSNMQRTKDRANAAIYDAAGNRNSELLQSQYDKNTNDIAKRSQNLIDNYGDDKHLSAEDEIEKAEQLKTIKLLEKKNTALAKQIASLTNLEQDMGVFEKESLGGVKRVTPNRNNALFRGYTALASQTSNAMERGVTQYYQDRPNSRNLAAAQGSYDSQQMRRNADAAGNRYGIAGSEMLSYESAYVLGAGYTSDEDVGQAGVSTGRLGRRVGATADEAGALTTSYAQVTNGGSAQSLAQFQTAFAGGLKKSGMIKNGSEQLKALTSLTSSVASNNGGSLEGGDLRSLASIQSLFASTKDKGLQGQSGADSISQLDAGLRNKDNKAQQLALMALNPGKYGGGIDGHDAMMRTMQGGIMDEDGRNAAFKLANETFGNRNGSKSAFFQENYGWDIQADQLDKLQEVMAQNGGDFSVENLEAAGIDLEKASDSKQQDSRDAQIDKMDAATERVSSKLGNLNLTVGSTIGQLTGFNGALLIATRAMASMGPMAMQNAAGTITSLGGGSGKPSKWGSKIKGTSAYGKLANAGTSFAATSAGSKMLDTGSKLAKFGGKALPYVGTTIMAAQAVPQLMSDEVSNQDKGKTIGNIGGTAAGFGTGAAIGSAILPGIGTIIGGGIGALIGGFAGEGVGGATGSMFDGNEQKNAEALEEKRSSNEDKRAENIKNDSNLAKGYTNNSSGSSSYTSKRESSDGGTSSVFAENLGKGGVDSRKAMGGNNTPVQVVLSGNVSHSGNVADISDVNASVQAVGNSVIQQIFNSPLRTNETRRK